MLCLKRGEQTLMLDGQSCSLDQLEHCIATAQGDYKKYLQELYDFLSEWFDDSDTIIVQTSGSTGIPKKMRVRKDQMIQSARMTVEFLNLRPGDSALLCMPLMYIAGKMMVVRALVASLDLYCQVPSGYPMRNLNQHIKFAAMVPSQVFNSLQSSTERERISQIETLIIGGGAIDINLEKELMNFPHSVYSTYGMTETLSHIALRKLNGDEASKSYKPFSSVKLSLSSERTLIIDAPLVNDAVLPTNDIAEIYDDDSFCIIGRKDNIINSGGVKVQIEKVEEYLAQFLNFPFAITFIPHPKWGEAIVLLIESIDYDEKELRQIINCLPKYWKPLYIEGVIRLPYTGTDKVDRVACKRLALQLKKK